MIEKICIQCGRNYSVKRYRASISLYCSRICKDRSLVGKPSSNKGVKRPYKARPSMRGRSVSPSTQFKYKNGLGRYVLAHNWITKKRGKPEGCESCGTKSHRAYHWANVSGEYLHEIDDWQRLCVPCHKRFDLSVDKSTNFPKEIKEYLESI